MYEHQYTIEGNNLLITPATCPQFYEDGGASLEDIIEGYAIPRHAPSGDLVIMDNQMVVAVISWHEDQILVSKRNAQGYLSPFSHDEVSDG